MPGSACLETDVFGVLYREGSQAVFAIQRESAEIVTSNGALEELLGIARGDLLGADATALFDSADRTREIVSRAGLHEEVPLRRLDGFPVYATLHVTHLDHSERGPLAACLATDNTERLLLERELITKHAALYSAHAELEGVVARLKATQQDLGERNEELIALSGQLSTAARRATIGELSAGIAHSINNPMAALSSTLRGIERVVQQHECSDLSQSLERLFKRTRTAATRMEQIVASVRAAHRAGHLPSKPQILDLARELEGALILFESRLQGIHVTQEIQGDTTVFAPLDAVHHVVANLIENAVQAMPGGGELNLQLGCRGDDVALIVSDTGDGIPQEIRSRVFEPFVSGRRGGTGLGLSMAHRLSRLWGGTLRLCESESGAALEVTFPKRSTE